MAAKQEAITFINLLWSRVAADNGPFRIDNLRTFNKLVKYQNIRTLTDKATPSGDALTENMMLLTPLVQQRENLIARKTELTDSMTQWQQTTQVVMDMFGDSQDVLDDYMQVVSTTTFADELVDVCAMLDHLHTEIDRVSGVIQNVLAERHDHWVRRMVEFSGRFNSYLRTANPKVDAVLDVMDYNF
jgi:hypothetical protein